VALFGSAAQPLWREVPRFREFARSGIEILHESKDVDLAVWLTRLDQLKELQRARGAALDRLLEESNVGVAHHQVDVFLFEPATDRYLGRLCKFGQCPKDKIECLVPDCGRSPFLRQHEGFRLYADALAPERLVRLFDRRGGIVARAADLPQVPAGRPDANAGPRGPRAPARR